MVSAEDVVEVLRNIQKPNNEKFYSVNKLIEQLQEPAVPRAFVASTNTIHKNPPKYLSKTPYADIARRELKDVNGYEGWEFRLVTKEDIRTGNIQKSGFEKNKSHYLGNKKNFGLWKNYKSESNVISKKSKKTDKKTMEPENKDKFSKIQNLLKKKKQIIFYGPPGTGKTYLAKEFAKKFYNGENIEISTPDFDISPELCQYLSQIEDINEEYGLEGTGKGYEKGEENGEKAKDLIREIKQTWEKLGLYLKTNIPDLENYEFYKPPITQGTNQAKPYYWISWYNEQDKYSEQGQLQIHLDKENGIRIALWFEPKRKSMNYFKNFIERAQNENLEFLDEIRLRTKDNGEILYQENENYDLKEIERIIQDENKVRADFTSIIRIEDFKTDVPVPKKIARKVKQDILPLFKFEKGETDTIRRLLEKRYELVTFHPSFSYEEFIEGIKAEKDGKSGDVHYPIRSGIFKELCERARKNPDENFLLIIDEINRGNISSIFGELITLLEKDKRGSEFTVRLPYSNDPFYIPENLYLIGTMNTADRSIALMDIALRRRFAHVEFNPDIEEYTKIPEEDFSTVEEIKSEAEEGDLKALSICAIGEINRKLMEKGLESGKKIGHSYFMNTENNEDIVQTWNYEILPLLKEYFFDNYEEIKNLIGDYNGNIVDTEMKSLKEFNEKQLKEVLKSLL